MIKTGQRSQHINNHLQPIVDDYSRYVNKLEMAKIMGLSPTKEQKQLASSLISLLEDNVEQNEGFYFIDGIAIDKVIVKENMEYMFTGKFKPIEIVPMFIVAITKDNQCSYLDILEIEE